MVFVYALGIQHEAIVAPVSEDGGELHMCKRHGLVARPIFTVPPLLSACPNLLTRACTGII